ncbi:MAG: response regulator [Pseudomonadales bacterium]|nr:response regulator [Pseudomonadales bacterium]
MSDLSADELSILLIEPSPTQRKVIISFFERESVENIDIASSKADALAKLDFYQPDLIVSSLYFDDGTSLELLREIRKDERLQDIPFMLISSETRRAQLEEFKQSGVIAILPKPFTMDNLHTAINATLDLLSEEELNLPHYDVQSLRVLVVDDSPLALKMINRVLSNLGIVHMTNANDGSTAIPILEKETFDLVITDYNMPEVNGAELAEFIRHSPQHSHLPVLMVSSDAGETHLSHVAQSGVDAIVGKPFSTEEVKKLLYKLLDG